MKRTPKRKNYRLKRSPIKRKRDKPRTSKGLFDNLKKEKKGLFTKKQSKINEWDEIREELKERFMRAGILTCELHLKNCTGAANFGWTWSFAHSLKRNQISKEPEQRAIDMREVVYACGACHYAIEAIGNKIRDDEQPTMADIVRKIIANRKVQP